ncbi:glutamate--tRNA ligase [Mycoplasma bradburyae]|uniref:glutamate--tRNA ligase n=1 Tax=Mycoplasma bradburyae TaxID=2963128 RepID=UPI00233FA916|nr:glutamate--tRNA ligase [Mycoplasma bradburyae]MDC4182516.1 glutamate--tRNA ligase [Mycoplasma bradburyae]
MSKIRTRYAPSPTGYFHIGGARTALFNYLFAKHNNGEFIVRIEDTDVERNVEGGAENQLYNLKWLNIFADESIWNPTENGPYRQSEKFDVYKKYAYQLLEENKAYRCFCTSEELQKSREALLSQQKTPIYSRKCLNLTSDEIQKKIDANIPFTIRLRLQDNKEYSWSDLIRGDLIFNTSSMSDPVILKSNGISTYNFAVVIDDHDMKISHILRGEEHISNTPYQLAIKESLGFKDEFVYGHLSIIVDETGKKLSKRNLGVEQFIEGFREKGYLSEALVNFIALLGWSHPDNIEILNLPSLIKAFTIKNLSAAPSFFDIKKLNWISSEYIKTMDEVMYLAFIKPYVDLNEYEEIKNRVTEISLMFKNQLKYGREINDLIKENFVPCVSFDNLDKDDLEFLKSNKNFKALFLTFKEKYEALETINEDTIKEIISWLSKQTKLQDVELEKPLGGKNLYMPIRIVISNKKHGPELNKIIALYDKNKVIENLDRAIEYLSDGK